MHFKLPQHGANNKVGVVQHSSASVKDEKLGSDKKSNQNKKLSDYYTTHTVQ